MARTPSTQTVGNWSAEMVMLSLGESWHGVFRATIALDRGSLKSLEKWESGKLPITFTVTCRLQSCCFAQSFPSSSLVCSERYRIDVKNWLSNSQILRTPARRNPWRMWMNSQIVDSHLRSCRFERKPPSTNVLAQGNQSCSWARGHESFASFGSVERPYHFVRWY